MQDSIKRISVLWVNEGSQFFLGDAHKPHETYRDAVVAPDMNPEA